MAHNVLLGGIYSVVVVALTAGILSLVNPRALLIFPNKIIYRGYYTENNLMKSPFLYPLYISIGFMTALFMLGISSIVSSVITKWLYLFFCIVMMREGMQMSGIIKLTSLFFSKSHNKDQFIKNAFLIGIIGGFLLYPVITYVFNLGYAFMINGKLLGILLFAAYVIGQSAVLLSLELLIATAQDCNTQNAKNKLIKLFPVVVFIFIGFIMSYFGFSYDFPK